MDLNQQFELSMALDTEHFQQAFINKAGYMKELDNCQRQLKNVI